MISPEQQLLRRFHSPHICSSKSPLPLLAGAPGQHGFPGPSPPQSFSSFLASSGPLPSQPGSSSAVALQAFPGSAGSKASLCQAKFRPEAGSVQPGGSGRQGGQLGSSIPGHLAQWAELTRALICQALGGAHHWREACCAHPSSSCGGGAGLTGAVTAWPRQVSRAQSLVPQAPRCPAGLSESRAGGLGLLPRYTEPGRASAANVAPAAAPACVDTSGPPLQVLSMGSHEHSWGRTASRLPLWPAWLAVPAEPPQVGLSFL